MTAVTEKTLVDAGPAGRYFAEPIPAPRVLQEYNLAEPRPTGRIIELIEDEARHRREMDRARQQHDSKVELRGQTFGFAIAILSLVIAGILIGLGMPLYGLIPLVPAVGGLSRLFVWTKSRSTPKVAEPPKRGRARL